MKKTTILSVVGMAWLSIVAGCGPVSQNSSVLEISDSSSQISSEQAAKLDAALQRDVAATEDYFWGRAERAATSSFHVELRKRAELMAAQFPPETIFSEQELEDLKSQLSLLRQVNVKSRAVGFIYGGESISLEEANQRYASDQERYRQVFVPASEAVQTYLNKYIERTGWDVVGQALKPANARAMIGFKNKRKSDCRWLFLERC